jgi:heterokaryon incompatibility protein (HET)
MEPSLNDIDRKGVRILGFSQETSHTIDRLRRHFGSHGTLCRVCESRNIPALFTWVRDDAEWDFQHVVQHQDCSFCKLLTNLVVKDHGISEAYKFMREKASLKLSRCSLWEYTFTSGIFGRRISIERSDSVSSDREALHDFCVHADPDDGSCILPVGQGTPSYGLSPRMLNAGLNFKLIRTWVETCSNSHGYCWKPTPGAHKTLQMIIDVRRGCIVKPPQKDKFRYVCLSYVWGMVDQPMLNQKTLRRLTKTGILFRMDLPQTIRDAINLTRDIGERFLWVDCLCLFHDNQESFQEQIEQMHLIYRQAYLTIMAAAGGNSNNGLPGVRGSSCKREPHHIADVGPIQLSAVAIKPHGELRKSVWNSRGWTFQEEICASRRLIFTKSLVLFSCAEATWREEFPERMSVNQVMRYAYPLYPAFGPPNPQRTDGEKEDILKWYSIVLQNYLSRSLTNSGDILKAFSGVTSLLSDVLGPVFWGLSEKYFHQAICWHPSGEQVPLRKRDDFPSWSWAGWHHPGYIPDQPLVKFMPRENGLCPVPLLQFYSPARPDKLSVPNLKPSHSHFAPDPKVLKDTIDNALGTKPIASMVLAFYTSVSCLWVESSQSSTHSAKDNGSRYAIRSFNGGPLIATVCANRGEISTGNHEFIVIGCMQPRQSLFDDLSLPGDGELNTDSHFGSTQDEDNELSFESRMGDSFYIMLIETEQNISHRKAVAGGVPASRWWNSNPERRLVMLA